MLNFSSKGQSSETNNLVVGLGFLLGFGLQNAGLAHIPSKRTIASSSFV